MTGMDGKVTIGTGGVPGSAVHQDTARSEDSERLVAYALTTHDALHFAVNHAGIR